MAQRLVALEIVALGLHAIGRQAADGGQLPPRGPNALAASAPATVTSVRSQVESTSAWVDARGLQRPQHDRHRRLRRAAVVPGVPTVALRWLTPTVRKASAAMSAMTLSPEGGKPARELLQRNLFLRARRRSRSVATPLAISSSPSRTGGDGIELVGALHPLAEIAAEAEIDGIAGTAQTLGQLRRQVGGDLADRNDGDRTRRDVGWSASIMATRSMPEAQPTPGVGGPPIISTSPS